MNVLEQEEVEQVVGGANNTSDKVGPGDVVVGQAKIVGRVCDVVITKGSLL